MGLFEVWAQLTALAAAGLLVLIMRWVFRPSRPRTGAVPDASDARELGLLSVIATGLPRTEANRQRALLDHEGVRASVSRRRDGTADLLVFSTDVERAQEVIRRGG